MTPYGRTLKTAGKLNPKYPGGISHQTRLLRAEGRRIIGSGNRYLVADYQSKLARLP